MRIDVSRQLSIRILFYLHVTYLSHCAEIVQAVMLFNVYLAALFASPLTGGTRYFGRLNWINLYHVDVHCASRQNEKM